MIKSIFHSPRNSLINFINTLILLIFGELVMSKKVTLKDEKILDSWSILIEDGKGRENEIYEKTKKYI